MISVRERSRSRSRIGRRRDSNETRHREERIETSTDDITFQLNNIKNKKHVNVQKRENGTISSLRISFIDK